MAKVDKADLPFDVFLKDYFEPVVSNNDRTIEELTHLQKFLETRIKVDLYCQ